ncbi:MAG: UDP-N-acetylmuramate dehydrogenase [Clostridia bacterium]|nr:UDP-N-acetylmuramate dehydrogenase [Clostridia bacterium]
MNTSLLHRLEVLLAGLCEKGIICETDYEISPNHSLSTLTSFRTGGPALVLFPKKEAVVIALLPLLVKENVPFFVLGNGSNVIAEDHGYDGVILSLLKMKETCISGTEITASAGASITGLAVLAQKNSLSGMEFFYGIPGSVGGAVFMNAGAYGGECKDILKSVTFVTREGEVQTCGADALEMGYRTSIFEKNGAVILSATFSLKSGDLDDIRGVMEDLMARRVEKQPLEYPSAGSTFKRYPGRFTAQLIDEAGLKGFSVGGAMVSKKHAGFVINYHQATSADILELIGRIQSKILEKEGITLECEVRLIR